MKILVVEDDTRVAAFINRGLREEGHVVDVAGDAEDGLSHAYVSQYDVIVIDVMLREEWLRDDVGTADQG